MTGQPPPWGLDTLNKIHPSPLLAVPHTAEDWGRPGYGEGSSGLAIIRDLVCGFDHSGAPSNPVLPQRCTETEELVI